MFVLGHSLEKVLDIDKHPCIALDDIDRLSSAVWHFFVSTLGSVAVCVRVCVCV